jgi:RimJ/RimL family protein N-acetyltransferase
MTAFDLQPLLTGQLVRLRPLRRDDFDELYGVASDPLIWAQHPEPERCQLEVFRGFFRGALDSGGALVALDAADGERIIGSSRFAGYDPHRSEVEIGWTFLARAYWGGRYNSEMKRLMLDHAFQYVQRVVFLIGHHNLRSQKAIQQIGAVAAGERTDGRGQLRLVYEIRAADWLARARAAGQSDGLGVD